MCMRLAARARRTMTVATPGARTSCPFARNLVDPGGPPRPLRAGLERIAQGNVVPLPETLFGNPGSGDTQRHRNEVQLAPLPRALPTGIESLHQRTSKEFRGCAVATRHGDGCKRRVGATVSVPRTRSNRPATKPRSTSRHTHGSPMSRPGRGLKRICTSGNATTGPVRVSRGLDPVDESG